MQNPDLDVKMCVYGLCDPRTGELRYVGKTISKLRNRYVNHLSRARTAKSPFPHNVAWLKSLMCVGLTPDVFVIQQYSTELELDFGECEHIEYYRFVGCDLTNHLTGGNHVKHGGTAIPTPSAVANSRAAGKRHAAYLADPAVKAKQSATMSALYSTPERRLRMGQQVRDAHTRDPDLRSRMSAAKIAWYASPEGKRVASEVQRSRYQRPEERRLSSERAKKMMSDPAVRLRISKACGGRPFKDENGNVYNTLSDAKLALGISITSISDVLKGKRAITCGHRFVYIDDPPKP